MPTSKLSYRKTETDGTYDVIRDGEKIGTVRKYRQSTDVMSASGMYRVGWTEATRWQAYCAGRRVGMNSSTRGRAASNLDR